MDRVPEIIAQCKFGKQQNLLYLLEEDEPAVDIAQTKFPFSIRRKNRHILQLLWIILSERALLHF